MKLLLGLFLILNIGNILASEIIGLDVRGAEELKNNPAKGAIHIELSKLDKKTIKRLPKDKEINIFCEVGGRAGMAMSYLKEHGFTKVKNIGSWREWNKLNKN